MGELLLLRHGETEWSKAGRHTGRTDLPLTSTGEQRARAAAPLLAQRKIGRVYSSPLVRAVRTAQLAGLTATATDDDLMEWDYGGYEGVTTAEIQQQRPGWDLFRDGVVPAGDGRPGETAADVGARCDRVLAKVLPGLREADDDVALVAHGHVLRVLTARWLELAPKDGALFRLDTATLSVLGFEHARSVIQAWNIRP